ncbi:GMC family oxidoreductase [Rhodococcus sp. NPDC057529]|uniref:GMC family oxidoreductase n=1 Tax=Rhodococcus sp. NPDC057529 TaxID=3346158 RepID=UPI00366DBED5
MDEATLKPAYDYIVIGSGSAGSVLAARLSEDSDTSVLLLEAGGVDDAQDLDLPIASPRFLKSAYDWDDITEPEPGLNGRRMALAHGRVLGGSSSINSMIYLRGSRDDYDGWASTGATDWSFDDVLPYFLRCENNSRGSSGLHNDSGPLSVSDCGNRSELSEKFVAAAVEAGHRYNEDLNSFDIEGVGYPQVTQRRGRRCSVSRAYLDPVKHRGNLTVATHAIVSVLVFDGTRVVGVEVSIGGRSVRLNADSEVLLCAGTYATAQLLMLSGIGPADHLRAHGISVRADLPVGQELQDHLRVGMVFESLLPALPSQLTPEAFAEYERHGTGPVSSNVGETAGFVRSNVSAISANFQVSGVPAMVGAMIGMEKDGFSLCGWVCRPTSRGTVTLRDANPLSRPVIRHNYLTTDSDRRITCEGIRQLLEIREAPALDAVLKSTPISAPTSLDDDSILEHVRRTAMTAHHPCGTAGIGRVVAPDLKVFGIDQLRVVDASVMPLIPSSNINAATIMVAEKGADLVKRDSARHRHSSLPAASF